MRTSAKVTISGAVLFVGSLVLGVGGTIMGMIRSFNSVAESGTGSSQELAEGISNSLISTVVGIPLALIGLGLLIGGLIVLCVRKPKADVIEQSA